MSKKILYLLGILLTIILGTFLYLKFCCNCCVEPPATGTDEVIATPVQSTDFEPFVLVGTDFNYHTNQNLKFLKNSEVIILPVKDSVTTGIVNLKDYLVKFPNQKVLITGIATSDEVNNTTYENLALARAHSIKDYFVAQGLPEGQFDTEGKILDSWKMDLDTLLGPASYKIDAATIATTGGDEWVALKAKINADPLILYFNTNKAKEQLTQEEKAKIDDIVKYIKNVPDAVIEAVGHTDDVGQPEPNVILGQKRADFAKNYLIENGVEGEKIEASSKGQTEPMVENTNPENQAKNRRAVITIK